MQAFPHVYVASAAGGPGGDVRLHAHGLAELRSASPAEFGGPGTLWSPETLLVGAVADCYILTFRAVAAAARLPWSGITCRADGTLEHVDRVTRFTHVTLHVRVQVPPDADRAAAYRAIERAEASCLISRSLNATVQLEADVDVAVPAVDAA